jgi:hypothetical protein
VHQNGCSLQYASTALKDDVEVVLAAVLDSEGFALVFASQRLNNYGGFKDYVCSELMKYSTTLATFDRTILVGTLLKRRNKEKMSKFEDRQHVYYHHHCNLSLCFTPTTTTTTRQPYDGRRQSSNNNEKEEKEVSSCYLLTRMGKYSSTYCKKLVGEYAGLQVGEKWRSLSRAHRLMGY